jgi:hypothetical protein
MADIPPSGYIRSMKRLKPLPLIVAAVIFDLLAIWAVGFTIAWGGTVPPLSAIGFWLFAASPVIVTAYCVHKWRAIRRGENPRT